MTKETLATVNGVLPRPIQCGFKHLTFNTQCWSCKVNGISALSYYYHNYFKVVSFYYMYYNILYSENKEAAAPFN